MHHVTCFAKVFIEHTTFENFLNQKKPLEFGRILGPQLNIRSKGTNKSTFFKEPNLPYSAIYFIFFLLLSSTGLEENHTL